MPAQDIADAARSGAEIFNEVLIATREHLATAWHGITTAATISMQFTQETARAHYNLAGQYTFPIEQEILGKGKTHKNSDDEDEDDNNDTTCEIPSPTELNVLGQIALGTLLPVVELSWIASVTVIPLIGNSILSLPKGFVRVANLALADLEEKKKIPYAEFWGVDTGNDHRSLLREVYGVPGYLIGAIAGVITLPFIAMGRAITNGAESGERAFMHVANSALHKDEQFNISKDKRHPARKYGFGFIGGAIGAVLGVCALPFIALGRTLTNSFESGRRAFMHITNFALHQEMQLSITDDIRHPFRKYGLGFMGGAIGAVLGIAALPFILIGRSLYNSIPSCAWAFVHVANLPLFDQEKEQRLFVLKEAFLTEDSQRSKKERFGFGAPGILLGAITGAIVALAIIAPGRIISQGLESGSRAFCHITNILLHPENKFQVTEDKRHPFKKYAVGFIGGAIGAVLGVCALPFIALGRALTNSFESGRRAFMHITNFALHKENEFTLTDDTRHPFRKYALGFVGGAVGTVLGIVALPFILIGRSLYNSVPSCAWAFVHVANLPLFDQEKEKRLFVLHEKFLKEDAQRAKKERFGFGAPGILLGAITGAIVALAFIVPARIISQGFESGSRAFCHIVNVFLHPEDKFQITEDNRHRFKKYVLGFIGGAIGAVLGVGALPFIVVGRLINNGFESGTYVSTQIANAALHDDDQFTLYEDKRSKSLKYGWGSIGWLIGAAIGVTLVLPTILIGRFFTNTMKTAALTVTTLLKYTLRLTHDNHTFKTITDNRSKLRKFLVGGVLGIPCGIAIGAFLSTCILTTWVIDQSINSWRALSGSLINGALNRPIFTGLRGDDRAAKHKIAGGLGYVIAAVTTGPIALAIFILRNVIPTLILAVCVIVSPAVLAWKCAQDSQRFSPGPGRGGEPPPPGAAAIIQCFKHLYSSLNGFGRLNVGIAINTDGDGNETTGAFLRKCFTLNADSVTERTLRELLNAYREYAKSNHDEKSFFSSLVFSQTIESIETRYNDCFTSEKEWQEISREIREVATFVKEYVLRETYNTNKGVIISSDFYSKNRDSWTATFFGKQQPQQQPSSKGVSRAEESHATRQDDDTTTTVRRDLRRDFYRDVLGKQRKSSYKEESDDAILNDDSGAYKYT